MEQHIREDRVGPLHKHSTEKVARSRRFIADEGAARLVISGLRVEIKRCAGLLALADVVQVVDIGGSHFDGVNFLE